MGIFNRLVRSTAMLLEQQGERMSVSHASVGVRVRKVPDLPAIVNFGPFFKICGRQAEIFMPESLIEGTRTTCFRGRAMRRAGNFAAWEYYADFLRDSVVRSQIISWMTKIVESDSAGFVSVVELTFNRNIGWDSIVQLDSLSAEHRARSSYGKVGQGEVLFLPKDAVVAPMTNLVTIRALVESTRAGYLFKIIRIHPGLDYGEVKGNLTEEQGLYFLHWDTDGEKGMNLAMQ